MFIHRSALLCDDCGENEAIALGMADKKDDGDSDEWPQYSPGSESDSPDHCDNCGHLLYEVALTDDGREYVALCLIAGMDDDGLACEWSNHADLPDPGDMGWDLDAVRAWADNLGTAVEALESFEDAYMGQHNSEEDWAAQYVEDTGMLNDVGDTVSMYFDYEAFARDCQLGGDMTFLPCGLGVFAFSNH